LLPCASLMCIEIAVQRRTEPIKCARRASVSSEMYSADARGGRILCGAALSLLDLASAARTAACSILRGSRNAIEIPNSHLCQCFCSIFG
jgi:hypothetical protein